MRYSFLSSSLVPAAMPPPPSSPPQSNVWKKFFVSPAAYLQTIYIHFGSWQWNTGEREDEEEKGGDRSPNFFLWRIRIRRNKAAVFSSNGKVCRCERLALALATVCASECVCLSFFMHLRVKRFCLSVCPPIQPLTAEASFFFKA